MTEVFMIGGANGSGKTTVAMTLLPRYLDVFEFVNADEIARGLNPLRPATADMTAGKVMIKRINDLIAAKKNFAFETTCSGIHHKQTLQECRIAGYSVNLIYLWLPSADMAVERVVSRVRQGGHSVPESTIRRRYASGLVNVISVYLPLVDRAFFFDASNSNVHLRTIAEKESGESLKIYVPEIWQRITASEMYNE